MDVRGDKDTCQDQSIGPYRGKVRALDQNTFHFPTKGPFPCPSFVASLKGINTIHVAVSRDDT